MLTLKSFRFTTASINPLPAAVAELEHYSVWSSRATKQLAFTSDGRHWTDMFNSEPISTSSAEAKFLTASYNEQLLTIAKALRGKK